MLLQTCLQGLLELVPQDPSALRRETPLSVAGEGFDTFSMQQEGRYCAADHISVCGREVLASSCPAVP